MAGRINNIDSATLPRRRGRSRRNRDSAILFLGHPVHRSGTLMGLAKTVNASRVIKDAFRRRRFAGVDMGHDADISRVFKGEFSWHLLFS